MKKVKVFPAVVHGKVFEDYYVSETGNLYSKKSGEFKMMTPSWGEGTPYPKTHFSKDGKKTNVLAHRVVAETLVPFPIPNGVTEKEWARTPAAVKQIVMRNYEVNHIDHDKMNYHPSNLEWVTSKENANKYQKHKRENRYA